MPGKPVDIQLLQTSRTKLNKAMCKAVAERLLKLIALILNYQNFVTEIQNMYSSFFTVLS